MKKNTTSFILISVTLSLVAALLCLSFRSSSIEQTYVASLAEKNRSAAAAFRAMGKTPSIDDISDYLKKAARMSPAPALVIAGDKDDRVILLSKNDTFIASREMFNSILAAYSAHEFGTDTADFKKRYFENIKFFVFSSAVDTGRLTIVFPYSLTGWLLLQYILEGLISFLLVMAAFGFLYLFYLKKKISPQQTDSLWGNNFPSKKKTEQKNQTPAPPDNALLEKTMSEFCASAEGIVDLQEINVYVNDDFSSPQKIFSYSGHVITNRLFSKNPEYLRLTKDTIAELACGSVIILEKRTAFFVPVFLSSVSEKPAQKTLAAIFEFRTQKALNGSDQKQLSAAVKKYSLFFEKTFFVPGRNIDPRTGICTSSAFLQQYYLYKTERVPGDGLAVIAIALVPVNEPCNAVKHISKTIQQHIPDDTVIGYYKEHIVAVSNAHLGEIQKSAENIRQTLAKKNISKYTQSVVIEYCAIENAGNRDVLDAAIEASLRFQKNKH